MIPIPPHLDVYYASTCAPCRLELPAILQALQEGKDIRILVVSDLAQAKTELAAAGQRLMAASGAAYGHDARDRLRAAGDDDGILPFTRAVTAKGTFCASWRGALTRFRIQALLSRCR